MRVAGLSLLLFGSSLTPETPAESQKRKPESRRHLRERVDRVLMPSTVTIEPIRSAELFRDGGIAVRVDGPIHETRPPVRAVSRRLGSLWRIEFAEAVDNTAVWAQYEIVGANGSEGRLTLAGGEASIPVHAEAIQPVVGHPHDGSVRAEGGVMLHLDLSQVTHSGTYTGTLIVTLNRF